MSFSDLFPGDGEEPEPPQPPRAHEPPAWLGPPETELGVAVPLNLVLARSGNGVVALSHAIAYSSGLVLHVAARAGDLDARTVRRFFHENHGPFDAVDDLPEGFLRFGLELADGRRVSNLGGRPFGRAEEAPPGPVLFERGGGGGQSSGTSVSWSPGFWLWPLPPAGKLVVYCEWPVAGIPLAHAELDAAPLLDAAARSSQVWEEEGHTGPWLRTSGASSFRYATAAVDEGGEADAVTLPAAELRALREALRTALRALQRLPG